jgi:hypothetical protein
LPPPPWLTELAAAGRAVPASAPAIMESVVNKQGKRHPS